MSLGADAERVLKETSRTFYIPILHLPVGLREAVASAYLCLRAIDEIEDHQMLAPVVKAELLQAVSGSLQASNDKVDALQLSAVFRSHRDDLPEVTLQLAEWAALAPRTIAPRIWDQTAAMADRMAIWAACGWTVHTEHDLSRYTFGVAGAVGLLLCDLWAWHDGTRSDRLHAVGFGRGLQAVNILRNRNEDLARGVDFFPDDWTTEQMREYAQRYLSHAKVYIEGLPAGSIRVACSIPYVLARATLGVMHGGRAKLTRQRVMQLIEQVIKGGDASVTL